MNDVTINFKLAGGKIFPFNKAHVAITVKNTNLTSCVCQ